MAVPAIPPSPPFVARNFANVKYVDSTLGSDSNNGSYQSPWKTISYANSTIGNGGSTLYVLPGTYAATVTWTALNVDIIGMATDSSLVNITGAVVFNHASSSVRCANVNFAGGFSHANAGNLYFNFCGHGAAGSSKSGAGYFQTVNCDFSNATGFSVSNGTSSMSGGKSTLVAVTNAAAVVGIYYSTNVILPSASAGVLFIGESNIYAATSGGTAVTTTGTAAIFMRDCLISDSLGALAKVSLAGAAGYSLSNVQFLQSTSTLTAPNLGSKAYFDNLAVYANIYPGNASTVTAAGTTTLNINSPQWQSFTGSTTQTVRLPATTSVSTGTSWVINNLSSGIVSVQNVSGTAINTVAAGTYTVYTYTGTSTNSGWLAVSSTSAATTATNLAGGSAGVVPYQSAANTTAFTAVGTSGQVLTSNGAAPPTWQTSSGSVKTYSIGTNSTIQWPTLLSNNGITDASSNLYTVYNTNNASIQLTNIGLTNYQSMPGFAATTTLTIPAYATATITTITPNSQYVLVNISNSVTQEVAGGTAGALLYQSATDNTSFITLGSADQVMTVNTGGNAPVWKDLPKTIYYYTASSSQTWASLTSNQVFALYNVITVYNNTASAVVITFGTGTISNFAQYGTSATSTTFTIPAFGVAYLQVGSLGTPTYFILALNGAPTVNATSLAGGAASQIPYQTAANTTAFIPNGTSGQLLKSNGTSAPTWVDSPLVASEYGSFQVTTRATVGDYTLNSLQGNMPVVSSTTVLLKAGVTYELRAMLFIRCTFSLYQWQTSGGTVLGLTGSSTAANSSDNAATTLSYAAYTPTVNTYVKLVLTSLSGYVASDASYGEVSIRAIASSQPASAVGNISGGAAGQVPYQTAASTTAFTAAGTTGQILQSNGTGAPTWVNGGVNPAVFATGSTTQSIPNNTNTVLALGTVLFDTNSRFNTGTSRFTPNVAGYYRVTGTVTWEGVVAGSFYQISVFKNGTAYGVSTYFAPTGVNSNYNAISNTVLIPLNGSTDYVEIVVRQLLGVATNSVGGGNAMQAEFVRAL